MKKFLPVCCVVLLCCGILFLLAAFYQYIQSETDPVHLPPTAISKELELLPIFSSHSATEANGTAALQPIESVQQLFSAQTQQLSPQSTIRLLATGDVLTARSVNSIMTQRNDFTWPFLKTADFLKSADITFINLETPLITDCPVKTTGMIFCGNLDSVKGLQYAGIDVVTIANNHAANQGIEGVTETEQALKKAGFLVTGASGPTYTTIKNTRFAFLGFNDIGEQPGITSADFSNMEQQIADAKTKADVVILEFHWGVEYTHQPTTRQQELAHFAIDHGADLVLGNHPHWFQPAEFYKGKLIVYSHGNFIFDQMWSKETQEGIVGEYTFSGKNLVGVQFIPIKIESYGQPRILEGAEAAAILKTFEDETVKMATQSAY